MNTAAAPRAFDRRSLLHPMRNAALVLAALPLFSCQHLPTNNTTRGSVDLAQRGEAVGKFTSQGTDRVHVVVENRGPGALSFSVTDDQGRTIESGSIGRTRRNFTWRPLESFVTFSVNAPDNSARFDYRVASESPFTVEWNLTHALAPRR